MAQVVGIPTKVVVTPVKKVSTLAEKEAALKRNGK